MITECQQCGRCLFPQQQPAGYCDIESCRAQRLAGGDPMDTPDLDMRALPPPTPRPPKADGRKVYQSRSKGKNGELAYARCTRCRRPLMQEQIRWLDYRMIPSQCPECRGILDARRHP